MFASAGVLLIMASYNNANSEKAESGKDAKIVASTDSTITAEVDTVVSVAQDTVAKVENKSDDNSITHLHLRRFLTEGLEM